MSPLPQAIHVKDLSHHYGDHRALDGLTFAVPPESIFGLLGPNGGGKTTLFRILATLLPVQAGHVELLGIDVQRRPGDVRKHIGVTFQSPSLDTRLTVKENLRHHGHLYGFRGQDLARRIGEMLEHLGLKDRERDLVGTLSGGLKRRVEIAKGLLHEPRLLLLDEPSTGLDPGARIDLWEYLARLKSQRGMTVLVTTHLMEEAERCDQLGILDRGRLVALDSPERLRASVGGDCLTIQSMTPLAELAQRIESRFHVPVQQVGQALRIEREQGHELLKEIVDAFPHEIAGISLGKPTLEDVFIKRTGHEFWSTPNKTPGERGA
jgi:ABC-2 type transport system ATP-binding protein